MTEPGQYSELHRTQSEEELDNFREEEDIESSTDVDEFEEEEEAEFEIATTETEEVLESTTETEFENFENDNTAENPAPQDMPVIENTNEVPHSHSDDARQVISVPSIEERMCWICLSNKEYSELDNTDQLNLQDYESWIYPCKCRGTQAWVHQACLRRWIDMQQGGDLMKKVKCSQCKYVYHFKKPPAGKIIRYGRRLVECANGEHDKHVPRWNGERRLLHLRNRLHHSHARLRPKEYSARFPTISHL